jgi:pilus assembly protein CpaB
MKTARIVVLIVAIAAGGLAALLAGRSGKVAAPQQAQANVTDVLVAKTEIPLGQPLRAVDLEWQAWPTSVASSFIRKQDRPDALEKLAGYVARAPFVPGEPIRDAKIADPKGGGVMAAILPAGARAISTQISPETGAGGFILPNDRVDVIVTKKQVNDRNNDHMVSETILSDVRVLAIDQTLEEKNGQKVVIGKTATLELTSGQSETLALAQRTGTISLALRSIVDIGRKPQEIETAAAMTVVRFGIASPTSIR